MTDDTSIGGGTARFPETRWSAIEAARSDDPAERQRALETLIAAYWKPVYKYVRVHWNRSNEDAKDLTQEFFARLIEKDFLEAYDPRKAKLRTFLRVCVDGVVQNADRAARRLKRGGDAVMLSLDFDAAESELGRSGPAPPDDFFEREWVRSLFELAVKELKDECEARGKMVHFQLFERYDLDDASDGSRRPTYEQLAKEMNLAVTDVTNYLAWARREFRRLVLEKLREMTASEDEFRREARALLGVEGS